MFATPLDPRCLRPVRLSLSLQVGLLLLGALAVDGGLMLKSVLCAAVAFWSVVGVMAWRRGSKLTTSDLIFLWCGLLVLSVACCVGLLVLHAV